MHIPSHVMCCSGGETGWFFVPHYGWQYDPLYSCEWAAYYQAMFRQQSVEASTPQYQQYYASQSGQYGVPVEQYSATIDQDPTMDQDPRYNNMRGLYAQAYSEFMDGGGP